MLFRIAKTLGALVIGALPLYAHATIVTGNLQAGLDAITQDGTFQDVNADQQVPDEVWAFTSSNVSVSVLLFEFAGYETVNTFGVYDIGDPTKRLELFAGSACGGAAVETTCTANDEVSVLTVAGSTFTNLLTGSVLTFSTDKFGYYLDSSMMAAGGLFFSQASLNADVADAAHLNTRDHMLAFAGDGSDALDTNNDGTYRTFAAGEFILAWEDLRFPSSDYDYSDFVVMVESVEAVPEPGTLALLGAGLLGLGLRRRRRA